MRTLLKSYAFSVAAAAVAVSVTLPGLDRGAWPVLCSLVLLSFVSGLSAVRIDGARVSVTPGDLFTFAAIGLAGPVAAPVTAVAATLGGALRTPPRGSVRLMVNVATVTLAGSCAGWAHFLIEQGGGARPVALFGAAVAFFLTNTLVIAGAIRITRGGGFFRTWTSSGAWTFGSTVCSALLALGLQSALTAVGLVGVILGLAGSSVLAGSFRQRRDLLAAGAARADTIFRELRDRIEHRATPPLSEQRDPQTAPDPEPTSRGNDSPVRESVDNAPVD